MVSQQRGMNMYLKKKNKRESKNMAKEIERYDIYLLNKTGDLIKAFINSLDDYNHNLYELHHYIPYQAYVQNPEWYKERGIKQKLILVSKICHEHIENRGVKVLTDEEFIKRYKISRWELLFNKKFSKY